MDIKNVETRDESIMVYALKIIIQLNNKHRVFHYTRIILYLTIDNQFEKPF